MKSLNKLRDELTKTKLTELRDELFRDPEMQSKISSSSHYYAYCTGFDAAVDLLTKQGVAEFDEKPGKDAAYMAVSNNKPLMDRTILS